MTHTEHPPAFRLDALAAGDIDESTAEHLVSCSDCRAYVESTVAEIAASPAVDASRFAAAVTARAHREDEGEHERRRDEPRLIGTGRRERDRWTFAATSMIAVAAGVFFLVRAGRAPDAPELVAPQSETQFKGGIQLAVVRDRGGRQERFATTLAARGGDRVRIEVGIDSRRPIEAGILGADGSWTFLIAPAELDPGVHYSEEGARFDDDAVGGWVLAGAPEAVELARRRRTFDAVRMIPIVLDSNRGE